MQQQIKLLGFVGKDLDKTRRVIPNYDGRIYSDRKCGHPRVVGEFDIMCKKRLPDKHERILKTFTFIDQIGKLNGRKFKVR